MFCIMHVFSMYLVPIVNILISNILKKTLKILQIITITKDDILKTLNILLVTQFYLVYCKRIEANPAAPRDISMRQGCF